MPGGPIREVSLSFDTNGPYSKEKLRSLLIQCAEELLNEMNENKDIQQFLIKRPFTIEDVEITIFNLDKKGFEVYDPGISTAAITNGKLRYRTVDQSDTFKFKNESRETFQEALKFLEKN